MSEATAMYTLGRSEVLQCGKCTLLFDSGSEMEITASPEGWVEILCPKCVEQRDADELAITATAEHLYGPPDKVCICGHGLDWHGHDGCNVEGCNCEMYEEPNILHALEAAKCGSCGRFHSECICK